MRLSSCLTVLVMLVGCGGAVEPQEAPADGQVRIDSEPAVSQQGPTSQPYYTCTEDDCPPGYCMTGVVRSASCPGGVAWVCNDMRYYACI